MSSLVNLVIPAAGSATRLRPLSSNTSKIMVRVNGKPCLDYIVEQAKKTANINEIIIVDGAFDDIRQYCKLKHPDIRFVKQGSLNGPRDAIMKGINELSKPELPLVVWLGDAIILEEDMPWGTDFLLNKEDDNHSAWCMWDGNEFHDKPSYMVPNSVALVGLYSFEYGTQAKNAFNNAKGYEISEALINYINDYTRSFKSVTTNKWYDIGNLPSFYKTCAELLNLKSRDFNTMEYDPELGTIRKSPDYHKPESVRTLQLEKEWYRNLSQHQSMFVPRVFDTEFDLIMSYESGTLLSDLMLYDNLPPSVWEYIIDKVFRVKMKFFNNRCEDVRFVSNFSELSREMWVGKTTERVDNTSFTSSTKSSIIALSEACYVRSKPISGMHGDLHFGNIMYDQQTDQIRLLDPRGSYSEHSGVLGDDLYDWAKLAHDLYHGYNGMVSNVTHNEDVKEIFVRKLREYNLPVDLILGGGLLLIASCVPLHYDDEKRQQRFIDYVENNIEKYSL